jgi:hypothetical protein
VEDWEEALLTPFREIESEHSGAELEFGKGGPTGQAVEVTLKSSNPNCAQLTALLMGPTEVDGTLGESFPIELWYREHQVEELSAEIRALIKAVVEGGLAGVHIASDRSHGLPRAPSPRVWTSKVWNALKGPEPTVPANFMRMSGGWGRPDVAPYPWRK